MLSVVCDSSLHAPDLKASIGKATDIGSEKVYTKLIHAFRAPISSDRFRNLEQLHTICRKVQELLNNYNLSMLYELDSMVIRFR